MKTRPRPRTTAESGRLLNQQAGEMTDLAEELRGLIKGRGGTP